MATASRRLGYSSAGQLAQIVIFRKAFRVQPPVHRSSKIRGAVDRARLSKSFSKGKQRPRTTRIALSVEIPARPFEYSALRAVNT